MVEKAQTFSKEALAAKKKPFEELMKRRFYYAPAFHIYGGVAGLYDYGPAGCAIKNSLEQLWREHFIIEDDLLELALTNLTPHDVLKTSGHVDKFSDYMVKDVKSGACYRADKIIEEVLEKQLEKEKDKMTEEQRKVIAETIQKAGNFHAPEINQCIKQFNIRNPETGNELSEAYPFNLMFGTDIGPTGTVKGFLRPETAQGIFVNFRKMLDYNGGRLPFGGATIGIGFRNEIAPRSGLLRVREFQLAEIEYFVDPENKNHPKFSKYADIKMPLYSAEIQNANGEPRTDLTIGEAVAQKIVNNETLAYFLVRTFLFLKRCGLEETGIRFRQHLKTEMAHYASDCWDAEVLTSYGWIEVVGHADRACYDLTCHANATKQEMVAARKFSKPTLVKTIKTNLNKAAIGKSEYKSHFKAIVDYVEALSDDKKKEIQEKLQSTNEYVAILSDALTVKFTKEILSFEEKEQNVMEQKFTPHVIEPAFGLGRILYCIFEHRFRMRNERRTYLSLPAKLAAYKASILPVISHADFAPIIQKITSNLKRFGISSKVDDGGSSIGKRYSRTDELGIPFAITIDQQTLTDHSVTLREVDTLLQVRIKIDEVHQVVRDLVECEITWKDVTEKYPKFTVKEEDEEDDK
eukprot:CAMPEP_0176458138 /NCGR_PEP_ID=MMETSP0127-20121128/32406_1 /TAXON_ID=938130 /ORGANISM="Platyophrya macrostoma, Strain WH" /LENGTH=634 /DNA_ID=CAMNT_0017848633 /DNA_START=45 /DNA_END=1949 /DNA_ORIENTATION=+